MRKILYFIPSVLYAAAIFTVSSIDRPALIKPPFPYFDKAAHFIEFAGFTFVLFFSITKSFDKINFKKKIFFAVMLSVIYAVTDEIHQSFTIYRKAEILDWAADAAGSAASGLMLVLYHKIFPSSVSISVFLLLLALTRDGYGFEKKYFIGTSMYFAVFLEEKDSIVYKENNIPKDPFKSVKDNGGNIIRLCINTPPYSNTLTGAESADWGSYYYVEKSMKRAKQNGLNIFLTFDYASFAFYDKLNPYSVPPLLNLIAYDTVSLANAIYNYTFENLDSLFRNDLRPAFVSIGNEINWRFLEPNIPEKELKPFDVNRKLFLIKAGIAAVRGIEKKYNEKIKIVMHIEGLNNLKWWLKTHSAEKLDFDVMALSFYHGWHKMGEFKNWAEPIKWLKENYGKDFLLLETAQVWTDKWSDNRLNILCDENIPETFQKPPAPLTQKNYMIFLSKDIIGNGGLGVIYWGGDYVGNNCWIYPDKYGRGSSWEDKTFWNFDCNIHDGIQWMRETYR
ncbi:MAG TPA: VanZ family protein [bacterium]|nr:VanZ family protein [bacterium]